MLHVDGLGGALRQNSEATPAAGVSSAAEGVLQAFRRGVGMTSPRLWPQ